MMNPSKSQVKRWATMMKAEIRSTDFGRGLFATQDIRQGETIFSLPRTTQSEPDMYSVEASPGWHIDCSQSPAGALNHACKANAAVRNGKIVAWACIKTGEEITINYRMTETHLASPFTCHCCNEEMNW